MAALFLIALLLAGLHIAGVQVCLFHRLTGWPCLTCGSSRAVAHLLHGEIGAALHIQPLATLALLTGAGALLVHAICLGAFRCVPCLHLSRTAWRILLVCVAVAAMLNWCYLFWRAP